MQESSDSHEGDYYSRDPTVKAIRGLFELIAFYCVIWAPIIGITAVARLMALQVAPGSMTDKRVDAAFIGVFGLALAIAVFWSFDGVQGAFRKERIELIVKRYGYPIILLLGAGAGWFAYGQQGGDDDERSALREAHDACIITPACLAMMENLNHGEDVYRFIAR